MNAWIYKAGDAKISNKRLLEAVFRLAWITEAHTLMRVNWRDMETEELGSVYEALLELTPRVDLEAHSFFFAEGAETKGNARKTSELQIRLIRASELNSHLKEMNLAAAGLAHETRNPLNIVRGLAQMLSKQDRNCAKTLAWLASTIFLRECPMVRA